MLPKQVAELLQRIGAVRMTFVVSLLLSWVATQSKLINRDGIYYLDTARTILEEGIGAAMRVGEWNFFPLLVAALAATTPLNVGDAAYFLNALLLAGTCALLVAWIRHREPAAAWVAVLVVLAMPAYNQYRSDILREYGFWFFSIASFWLAMRWHETSRWRDALASQLALVIAMLFRLEAAVFFLALALWQLGAAPRGVRLWRASTICAAPIFFTFIAAVLVGTSLVELPARYSYYLQAANPLQKLALFQGASERFFEHVLVIKYSREEAAYVLFFGLLSIIPVKFINLLGFLAVPLAYLLYKQPSRAMLARWQPLPWAFLVYALMLAAFVTHQFFLSARYVSMLNLLVVPVATAGFTLLAARFPRWKILMFALAGTMLVANVVSLSPRQTHIVAAGRWLAEQTEETPRVCLDSARIAYYAGWHGSTVTKETNLDAMLDNPECILALVEFRSSGDEGVSAALRRHGYFEVQRFVGGRGGVIVATKSAMGQAE